MSQYGRLKHIIDLETMLGFRLSQIDFTDITNETISYSWGDETELINWIRLKDQKEQYNGNLYTISGNEKTSVSKNAKYPLIWLATPTQGENESDIKRFRNVRLIVCTNTEEQWLNSTRWGKHIPMLQAITDRIIDKLRGSVRIDQKDGIRSYSYRNVPKYSISESGGKDAEQKALDVWDAVVLNTDLIIDDSCRTDGYYEFYNK